MIECLKGHTVPDGGISDNNHYMPCFFQGFKAGFKPHTQRNRSTRMSHLENIVITFHGRGKAGQPPKLTQGIKTAFTAGQYLVGIRLMRNIEKQTILFEIEYFMQGQCQFHHAQIGRQMSSCLLDPFN